MSYSNITKTLKIGINKEIYKFVNISFKIAKRSMSEYSNRFSKKTFTQWQLFVLLAIKIYSTKSYRELISMVEYNLTIIEQLSLEYIPHFSTIQKFMKRMKVKGLEYVFRKALLIFEKLFKNEMIDIEATVYSIKYHLHYYDKRVREFGMRRKRRYMKSTISVALNTQIITSFKVGLNFRNDVVSFYCSQQDS